MHKPSFKDLDFLLKQHRAAKKRTKFVGKRIGIYAGTFNPVHSGHIAFALQALDEAELDQVVFLPERTPRYKSGVEHFGHRVAMLNRAVRPHPRLAVLELVDKQFTTRRTLPQLKALFPGAQLVVLMGSDVALELPNWPHANTLLRSAELLIGVRTPHAIHYIEQIITEWPAKPLALRVVLSHAPDICSSDIREAIKVNQHAQGLLASVKQYARQEWLYVSTSDLNRVDTA